MQDLDLYWNPLDPASSETALRALLPDARLLTGRDRCSLIELLTQIARAEGAQKKMPEAALTLAEAEKILAEPCEYNVSAKLRWLIESARLYVLNRTPSQARALLSQAWVLAVNAGEDYFTIDIAQMMAAIESPKAQHEWVLKAIQIAENSRQEKSKRWLGELYSALAWKLCDLRQFDKSFESMQKALHHFRVRGSDPEIFQVRWSIGKILRQMGRFEEALQIQQELLVELGSRPHGRLFEELAENLHALHRTEAADKYFSLAYEQLSADQWVSDNQPVKLKRLKTLGKVR